MNGSFGGDGGKFLVVLLALLIKTHFLRKMTEHKIIRKESKRGNTTTEFDGSANFCIIDCRKFDIFPVFLVYFELERDCNCTQDSIKKT